MSRHLFISAILISSLLIGQPAKRNDAMCEIVPAPYPRALRNPMKGFTTLNARTGHEWATLAHCYIPWNAIENDEGDGIEKIQAFCDQKWRDFPKLNVKVIPRVYLHWSGDRKYWPADMQTDDYASPQFQRRVLRLVDRLGQLWNDDPRVAFVELGIFGKWGEHHSPSPTPEMQRLVADAYAKAFPDKQVSVRQNWQHFTSQPFGEYWDSWAHYQQVWAHGKPIADLNARTGRWKQAYIGGETAYDWGLWQTQPGKDATASVSLPEHRDFIIHTIRWLHCTQLRWIGNYDAKNEDARRGAEEMQKVFGYRFVLDKVAFQPRVGNDGTMAVSFQVRNEGAAPFYYQWPVEASLLDPETRRVVWRGVFKDVDIRSWLPGDGWTEPEWIAIDKWPKKAPKPNWSDAAPGWRVPPKTYDAKATFQVDAPAGKYLLALAVLDPAGEVPSLRFATANYLKGGRHPVGLVGVGDEAGGPLPKGFALDDPHEDQRLHYVYQP
jgi:hypothetical protein